MRFLKTFTLLQICVCGVAFSQEPNHPSISKDNGSTAVGTTGMEAFAKGLGNLHHPVSTKIPEAQKAFDEGLRLVYAFNHDEAVRSFERAAKLDPKLAMAYWGIAYAKGPNYNLPVDQTHELAAYAAVQKAETLSASDSTSQSDKAYVKAVASRYSDAASPDYKKLAIAYKDAMKALSQKYPDDLDAATIYAESMMDLNPWGLWANDGTPWDLTPEILKTLESVLRRDPDHMGAIHFYIHAVEASPDPERALAAANRLAALAPTAGHLVHMPAHIYSRIGDFDDATKTNVKAAKADEDYAAEGGIPGIYPMMYYSHNLHFIAYAGSMEGRYAEAKAAAEKLAAHVAPHVAEMPPLETFMSVSTDVDVRFHKWDKVLKAPAPAASLKTTTALWHYARGLAFAGQGNIKEAAGELQKFSEIENATPPDEPFNMNNARTVLKIAEDVLIAKIALTRKDTKKGIAFLYEAVALQDGLKYGEPPDWFSPVRETLGAALMADNQAAEAEKVFRADLEKNPRNGRSLFGLREALKAQGNNYDAAFIDHEFAVAWKNADVKLSLGEL